MRLYYSPLRNSVLRTFTEYHSSQYSAACPGHFCPLSIVKNAGSASLWSPQVLRSRAGSRRKGLGFSLCAAPSRMAVLVFRGGAELSRDGFQTEVRTQVKGSRFKSGGESESESESESEKLRRLQGFAKSIESRIRLLI
jgi:hypothetical protein